MMLERILSGVFSIEACERGLAAVSFHVQQEISMHTIRTHFGGLDDNTMFIYNGIVYKKMR